MYLTTRRPRRFLAVAATSAFLLAGCSTSGGSDAAPSTTKAPKSSTTIADETTTTTEADDPGEGPSSEDLEALLPTAADLGDDWEVDDSAVDSDEDDETDKALEEQCPGTAAFTLNDDEDDDVQANFANTDNSRMEVSVTPSANDLSDEDLEAAVEAINDCDDITLTDSDDITTTFTFSADLDPDYGDQGIRLEAEVTLEGGTIPQPVTLMVYAVFFRYGSAGVSVTGTDGIDEATFEPIDVDTDLLLELADDLDQKVSELVD